MSTLETNKQKTSSQKGWLFHHDSRPDISASLSLSVSVQLMALETIHVILNSVPLEPAQGLSHNGQAMAFTTSEAVNSLFSKATVPEG